MNLRNILISFFAILSGVCFGVAVMTHLLINGSLNSSWRAYVVQSGSMEPAIKTGAVVITKSASEYKIGDVITFAENGNQKKLITHRIYSENVNEGYFTTKGDANEEPDNWKVTSDQIIGKQAFNIPYLGYMSNFVRTPKGFVALVVIPASIVIYEEIKTIFKEILNFIRKSFPHKRESRSPIRSGMTGGNKNKGNGLSRTGIALPIIGAVLLLLTASGAYFADREGSVQNILGAASSYSTPPPSSEPTPTPPPPLAKILITEVYYAPDEDHVKGNADTNNFQWVEIYNYGDSDVNIKDFKIEDNTSSQSISNSNRNLPAHKKVVIGKADNVRVLWGIDQEDFIAIGSVIGNGLANGGDRVILKDSFGRGLDALSYGSEIVPFNPAIPVVAQGHSIKRIDDNVDTDTAADFSDNPTPDPGV